jgi:hypothetical protein
MLKRLRFASYVGGINPRQNTKMKNEITSRSTAATQAALIEIDARDRLKRCFADQRELVRKKNAAKFRYEVVTVRTYKTRSLLAAVVDQINHIVLAVSPEEACDIVLKREASPKYANFLICSIINLDVADRP